MSAQFSISHFSYAYFYLLVVVALFNLCLSDQNYDVVWMDGERQALLEFKHGLIDETNRLASWVGEESDYCRWAGIVCDNFTGHVHQIHLRAVDGHCYEYNEASRKRLRGNLSSSLLRLKQLRHLDLSCNDFGRTPVPKFIASLGNLRYLNLSGSHFVGIIPPQLGNLSKLHTLCLANHNSLINESTSMMSMQWLSSLRWLHHLDLSGVDLSKAIDWLQVINTLSSIVELDLSYCQISHVNPHESSLNLTSLSLLDLSYNNFNSPLPPWILSITSMVSLYLSDCKFHGPVPGSIYSFSNLTSLKFLHVSGNKFMNSSLVLNGLSSSVASNLFSLDISYCGISSPVLDALQNLTSLLSLDLSGNQLANTLPESLGNFCNFKEIDLSVNNFYNIRMEYLLENLFKCKTPALESLSISDSKLSFHLPSQLGQLIYLVDLQLSTNHIVGTIPDSIGQITFLRTLDLSENQISGHIPVSIGQLSSLEVLDLSYNHLDGSLPESLGQLSKLKFLSFNSNFLRGVVTETHFVNLVSLKALGGEGNNLILRQRLANWIPPFQLEMLNVNSWSIGPQFPLWLHSQKELRSLEISNIGIYSAMPSESFWRSLPNLLYLDMSHNRIQGTLTLAGIPTTLISLDLSSNNFTGKLPNISNGSFPFHLDLSNNFFRGSLHHLLCSDGLKLTEILILGNNSLSGVIPECWEKWQDLAYLSLENNHFSGEIPRTLGHIYNLQWLNMHGNKLSGRLPASLMNLNTLEILQLGANELDGSIPSWFGTKLYSLRILNLRSNNLGGNIPHELCSLTHIQILDLADNKLQGDIPRCFNNFRVLSGKETITIDQFELETEVATKELFDSDSLVMKGHEYTYTTILGLVMLLDLSSNNLVGHIPSELTALVKLKSLNLSRNHLTGRIPENIGDMKELESFDLSLNKLSGELPMSLSSLNSLSSFNVSCNNLTGIIPSSTQLQSLNESCFVGNNLCGDPLTEHCIRVESPDKGHEKDDGTRGADWALVISMVFGFIAGFWIIVAPLMVSRSWRIAFYRLSGDI